MNVTIEFGIYAIAGLALVAVPLALIAGFGSRSLNLSAEAHKDRQPDHVRNRAHDARDDRAPYE